MEDHQSQVDETTLVLKKGDIVEVLDSDLPSKWFIRTSWSSSSNSVGWVSPTILERLPVEGSGEEGGPPGRLVHASSMPQLSSGEGKFRFGNAKAFGSHDLQSLQVCDPSVVLGEGVRGRCRCVTPLWCLGRVCVGGVGV